MIGNDPRLVLKITPPRVPRSVLERARLSGTRPEFADKAVIALYAGPGLGKTSLLAQWRKEALQAGCIVLWLTLDPADDEARIVCGLTAAMRANSARPNFGQACLRALEQGRAPLEAVTEWLAEVTTTAAETLLVLDDVHELAESTVGSTLVYLLLNAPANLRIVLSSRQPLALPISELPARGRYAALGASELRFDQSETVAVLTGRFGARIDLDSCVRLHELTEGWPLGLQLAVSTIERSDDPAQAIGAFTVRSSDIHRDFFERLIDRLPPAMGQRLVRLAVVDALSPSLCEAITQEDGGAAALSELRRATPIFSAGVGSEWVRMHALAHAFLRERFAQLPPAERRELHLRAGRWLADHDLNEEAARHLLEAGRSDLAYDLVERCLHDVGATGQVARVTYWIERLPPAEIMRRTSLRLTVGWMLALSERHAEAVPLVESIADSAAADALAHCESAEIRATAAFFADDIDRLEGIMAPWLDALPADSPLLRVVGCNLFAMAANYRGLPELARRTYAALAAGDSAAGSYALGWRDWIVGFSFLWEGQANLAAASLRPALARAEADSGRRSPISVMLAAALAAAVWDLDRTDEAAALLADRYDVLERQAPPDALLFGQLTAARIHALAGHEHNALNVLVDLDALGQRRGLPRVCLGAVGEQIRMHALRGRVQLCGVAERRLEALLAALADRRSALSGPVIEVQAGIARAYAALARGDWRAVRARLDAVAPIAERLHRGRDTIQITLLSALAGKRCGEDATERLAEAVAMARVWGLARVLADTHPDLVAWAAELRLTEPAQGAAQPPGRAAGA